MSYFGDWSSREGVASDFDVELGDDVDILFAWYSYEDYSGHAFVLFRQDDKLFEVNGSHCSCYGLEDQWSPERVDLDELRQRVERRYESVYNPGYNWNDDMPAEARRELVEVLNEATQD